MRHDMKTIRLIYPQWQGGDIARWIPEIDDKDFAARGYALGARLLDWLVPAGDTETYTVPVATGPAPRVVADGVLDRDIIARQTRAALDILGVASPDRIVTLGGECSTSVAPFTYLSDRYDGDLAVVWIDAHPDITLPGDAYTGYHAMAVTACMGMGDRQITGILPARIDPSRIMYVGLRDWERDEIRLRHRRYGIPFATPEAMRTDSREVTDWLKTCGASRVAIHLDLDVLDPAEIIAAVGIIDGGMTMAEVSRTINDIANEKELVALTVAEHMPRTAMRMQMLLGSLPLIGR